MSKRGDGPRRFICSRCRKMFDSSSDLMEGSEKRTLCADCYRNLLFPGVREYSSEGLSNSIDSRALEGEDPNIFA